MIKPRTADDVRRNIRIYQDEAERSRKMAFDRRQEADAEIKRAVAMERRVAELRVMLADQMARPPRNRTVEAEGQTP